MREAQCPARAMRPLRIWRQRNGRERVAHHGARPIRKARELFKKISGCRGATSSMVFPTANPSSISGVMQRATPCQRRIGEEAAIGVASSTNSDDCAFSRSRINKAADARLPCGTPALSCPALPCPPEGRRLIGPELLGLVEFIHALRRRDFQPSSSADANVSIGIEQDQPCGSGLVLALGGRRKIVANPADRAVGSCTGGALAIKPQVPAPVRALVQTLRQRSHEDENDRGSALGDARPRHLGASRRPACLVTIASTTWAVRLAQGKRAPATHPRARRRLTLNACSTPDTACRCAASALAAYLTQRSMPKPVFRKQAFTSSCREVRK